MHAPLSFMRHLEEAISARFTRERANERSRTALVAPLRPDSVQVYREGADVDVFFEADIRK